MMNEDNLEEMNLDTINIMITKHIKIIHDMCNNIISYNNQIKNDLDLDHDKTLTLLKIRNIKKIVDYNFNGLVDNLDEIILELYEFYTFKNELLKNM